MKVAKRPTTPEEPDMDVIKKALKMLKVKYGKTEEGKGLYRRAVVSYDQGHSIFTIRIPIEHLKRFMKHIEEKHGLEKINITYGKWNAGIYSTGHEIYFYATVKREKLAKFSARLLKLAEYIKEKKA